MICKTGKGRQPACALFTGVDISYGPIGVLVPDGGIDAVAAYCRALGEEYFQFFASMLVFDALIYNEDRHFGNFGLLFDAATAQPVGPAPLQSV